MRKVRIPVVLVTGWKEEPMVYLYNEGETEEEICAALSDEWLPDEPPLKTMNQINEAISQFEFELMYHNIKVKS